LIGFTATSCFTKSVIHLKWERRRSPSFLTWLASNRGVSASTQNQALSAVLFVYRDVLHIEIGRIERVPRARVPVRVPVVLSRDEVARIMKHLNRVMWLIVA
jgi:hypothetical protein